MPGLAAEHRTHGLNQDDADAKGDQDLVLWRAMVEQSDHDPFYQHARDKHEQCPNGDPQEPRAGRLQHHEQGIGAQHEQSAVSEVQHAEGAEDDGQATADQGEQRAECEAVECLRQQ